MRIGKRIWAVTIVAGLVAIALNVFDAGATNIERRSIPPRMWGVNADTLYLGGEHVRIPAESEFDDVQAKGTMKEGRLAILAKNESPVNYGLVVYAHRDSASYPSRLINLVANQTIGGTTNGFTNNFIAQRIKVNIESNGVNPATGLHVLNSSGQNMYGINVTQAGPDSAVATNILSLMTTLTADGDGKVASNIYTSGGHIKFLDGDTETESLYVDLDHAVIASDSVFIQAHTYISPGDNWPPGHQVGVSDAALGILHSSRGSQSRAITVIGDTTYDHVATAAMVLLYQPSIASKQMSAAKGLHIDMNEATNAGACMGAHLDFANGVTGYPLRIQANNTDSKSHSNIYSTITNDNGASWNIYADGGRNYFGGGATTIADTLILSSAQTAGWGTLGAEGLLVVTTAAMGDSSDTAVILNYIGASDGTVTPTGFLFADSLVSATSFVAKSTNAAADVGQHFSWVLIRH